MARTKKMTAKGPARNTQNGSNILGIQKVINRDYADLTKDYGKLFVEMYRSRYGRIAIFGACAALCVPLVKKLMANPSVDTFIHDVSGKLPWNQDSVDHALEAQ